MQAPRHLTRIPHRNRRSQMSLVPTSLAASAAATAATERQPLQRASRWLLRQARRACCPRHGHHDATPNTSAAYGGTLLSWQDARFTSTGRKARPLGPTRVEQTRLPRAGGREKRKNNTQRRGPGTPQSGHVPRTRPLRTSTRAHKQSTRIGRAPLSSFAVPERAAVRNSAVAR